MTNLPSLPHSFTIGAAAAAPQAKAIAADVAKSLVLIRMDESPNRVSATPRACDVAIASPLSSQSLAAADEGLQHGGEHDDRAGRQQLQCGVDVVELQHIGERAEHHRAGDGADDRAGAAEQ